MCGKSRQDAKDDDPASSPVTKKHAPPPKGERQQPRIAIVDASHKRAKRKSEEPRPEPKKRQKKTTTPNPTKDKVNNSDAAPSSNNFIGFGHEEQESEGDQELSIAAPEQVPDIQIAINGDHSDSELSDLLDEARAPKKKRKRFEPSTKPDKTTKSKTGKAAAASTLTPHEEEIKRLQGWLVKCGTRKIWGVYLARFETPKDKISHLKSLLKDAGMESRYSEEKARQIKEERELKADLEDIQKRNQKWGQKRDETEESATGRPRRKVLAKGLQELELFANDGEESD